MGRRLLSWPAQVQVAVPREAARDALRLAREGGACALALVELATPMAAAPRKGGPEPTLWTVPDPTSGSEGVLRAGGGAGGSCASEGSVLGRDDTIEPRESYRVVVGIQII